MAAEGMSDWFGYLLGLIVVVIVLLPPKWDPAIRWKERQEGWDEQNKP
jgi:hypothetical protein